MNNNGILKYLTASLLILFLIMTALPSFASAATVEDAYDKSDAVLEESYKEAFGWDPEKINRYFWDGDDGEKHKRYSLGYQNEAYRDGLDALQKQLETQGYELDLWEGSSTASFTGMGAKGMVKTALGEVGADRSFENPKGSNNVFYNEWYYGRSVSGDSYPWCAVFISWCADQCGYIESGLFARTASCREQYAYLTSSQGFASYPVSGTGLAGGSYEIAEGDIVFWRSGSSLTHIGIVTSVGERSIDITQGNYRGCVCTLTYTASSLSGDLSGGYIVHVEYPGFSFGDTGEIQDTTYIFLTTELGMSPGGACGAMGNFQVECAWNLTAVGDNGTSFGLCQWHNDRWQNLRSFCAGNGFDDSSLEGQLRFLQHELSTTQGAVMPYMQSAGNSAGGARSAALSWAQIFEVCTPDSYSARQSYAESYWSNYGKS